MGNIKDYDLLGWADDKDIKNIIGDEKIYYSDFVSKITTFGLNQERILLLTNKNLYYMKIVQIKINLLILNFHIKKL